MKDSRFSLHSSETPLNDVSSDIDDTRFSWGALYPHFPERRRFRFEEVVAISILAALFILLGLGIILYYFQSQPTIVWSPTPTPTSTSTPISTLTQTSSNLSPTETPDLTATQSYINILTEANQPTATLLPTATLTGLPAIKTQVPSTLLTVVVIHNDNANEIPTVTLGTPVEAFIYLPVVNNNKRTLTASGSDIQTPVAVVTSNQIENASEIRFPLIHNGSTPTPTSSPTVTTGPTSSATFTPTSTPTSTLSPTDTPSPIPTSTPTPTFTETSTDTPSSTFTLTITPTPTPTHTDTPIPDSTLEQFLPLIEKANTPTEMPSPTATPTVTLTEVPAATETETPTPFFTVTPTNTSEPSATLTAIPEDTATETPTLAPPTEIPTDTPTLVPTATPIPTETPTPEILPTETLIATATEAPSETPTEIPTEIPTEVPTETQTPIPAATAAPTPTTLYRVETLNAIVRNEGAEVYLGPSSTYTNTGTLQGSQEIKLQGRNETGAWLYVCCYKEGDEDKSGWIHHAYAPPADNTLEDGAPEGTDANDVQLLNIQPLADNLNSQPIPTIIPEPDYPLYRRDQMNLSEIAILAKPPLQIGWARPATAGGPFTSPMVVVGESLFAISEDNHLYSFNKTGGNQRWRYDMGQLVKVAPAVQGNRIYVLDVTGKVLTFEDQGNQANLLWERQVNDNATPTDVTGGINQFNEYLFFTATQNDQHQLIRMRQDNGDHEIFHSVPSVPLQYPTIGRQVIYIGGQSLWAKNIHKREELIWQRTDIGTITVPPIYSSPGRNKLAELYAANNSGNVYALDANTGRSFWTYIGGDEPVTGLAINDELVFASGLNFVAAIRRENGEELWRTGANGNVLAGPYVTSDTILIFTDNGSIQFLRIEDGGLAGGENQPNLVSGIVSSSWIFAADQSGSIQAYRGQEPE